ncbi:MAG: TlyA family RNA methyltransferase [Clostridia bacterium]|nr:TlyA family RNA methyltransferase [Clostridia bacterium]
MESKGVRLDTWLVQQGYASGREKAKELLSAGYVLVDGAPVTKASRQLRPGEQVECRAPAAKYVGRGGYKLEKAIQAAELSLSGAVAMDVGASTGGFTDCMLQSGAAHVYAVDVGHDQLHPTLRQDGRVTVLEGTDIRSEALAESVQPGSITFCSVDVSFVSLEHILPAVLPYLAEDATLTCLIKPQFEAGKSGIGKHGVVRDRKVHLRVLTDRLALFQRLGLGVLWLAHSPITGGEGNIEYLAVLRRQGGGILCDPANVVATAFAELT